MKRKFSMDDLKDEKLTPPTGPLISWEISDDDLKNVTQIVKRACSDAKARGDKINSLDLQMDLVATHANGCPMRFADLLKADDFNFWHDISGIRAHLDRETGNLTKCFLPRFSKRRA
jgi:hypothetical protein